MRSKIVPPASPWMGSTIKAAGSVPSFLTTVSTVGFVHLLCYGEKRNRGKDLGKLRTVELDSAR